MNKQINRYKEFADKIDGKYNQKAENYLWLQGDVFTISKELSGSKQNIVFSFKVSRPAYHSYHYTNYVYLPINDKKIKTLHIKKTFLSSILPIKSSYDLIDKSNFYGLSVIELIKKHKIEVVEEIYSSKNSDVEYENTINIRCSSKFLDLQELTSLYDFVVDFSKILSTKKIQMIELKPFTESNFELFKSWIKDEEQLVQFGGEMFVFPVTDEQLENYISKKDIQPLKVVWKETGETIGHCELNYQDGNKRLSRILIGENKWRGQKIGEQIVRKMVELFFEDENLKKLDLNVFDWNKGAIKCYENVGFEIKHKNTTLMKVGNKMWVRLNMELERK